MSQQSPTTSPKSPRANYVFKYHTDPVGVLNVPLYITPRKPGNKNSSDETVKRTPRTRMPRTPNPRSTQYEGGAPKKQKVSFKSKQYTVRTDEQTKRKCIRYQHQTVYLGDIRGQYKYIK